MTYLNAEFKNLSAKNVSALKFTAVCYNSFGEPVNDLNGNRLQLIMQDLDIGPKNTFGKNINYSLTGFEQTRIVDLVIDQVSFNNSEMWKRREESLKDISSYTYNGDQDLSTVAGSDAITYPFEDSDTWRCVCGKFNKIEVQNCLNCDRVKSEVLTKYNKDTVNNKINKENEIIKIKAEEAKRKSKKRNTILLICMFTILIISSSVIGLQYFNSENFKSEKISVNKVKIFKAVEDNNILKIQKLIDDGVDINVKDESGDTLLHKASSNKSSYEIVKFLIDQGADVNAKDKKGLRPLQIASNYNNEEIMKLLRENGATR